jgi:hypothetical protein
MALRRGQAALPPSNFGSYPKQNSYNLKIQGGGSAPPEGFVLLIGLRPRFGLGPIWLRKGGAQTCGGAQGIKEAPTAGQSHRLTSGGEAELKRRD